MQLGELEIAVVSGGRMWFDGGTVFGMVPKALWGKHCATDELNRVELDTNCLLVRGPAGTGLIETGYGSKAAPRERENYGLDAGNSLLENLARLNVRPADIDWVVLTHLHFDHAGGCTRRDDGHLRHTFPRARHFIQRAEWEDATADLPELAGSYFREDFEPLGEAGLVELVDGQAEPMPGVAVRLVGGHTRGHQIVYLGSGSQLALCPGDLCPCSTHVKTFWCTAFDQFPLTVRRQKAELLGRAADHRGLVIFGHDTKIKAAYLTRDKKGGVAVAEAVTL